MNLINRLSYYLYLLRENKQESAFAQYRANLLQSVIVPDVSFWQAGVDFDKMRANGAAGAIIRIGQGDWIDAQFITNHANSEDVFPRGGYWFWDSRYKPANQAAKLVSSIKSVGGYEMETAFDYEENYGGAFGGWRNFAAMIGESQRLLPNISPAIYTGYYYWLDHSPNPLTEKASFDWFKQFPLWLAWYTDNPANVKIPLPWTEALLWQFTSKGNGPAYGTDSLNIDLSYFNGTRQAFDLRYGSETLPPEPEYSVTVDKVDYQPDKIVINQTIKAGVTSFEWIVTIPPAPVDPEPPEPPAPPAGLPALYRILDDLHAPASLRPGIRKATACTVRMKGVSSSVRVPQKWIDYLRLINSDKGFSYLFNQDSGWHNGPAAVVGEPFDVETILMAGNIIEVTRIEGERAYFRCVHPSDSVPASAIKPLPDSLHRFIHLFSLQYPTYLDMEVADKYGVPRYPRILPIVPDGQTPWVEVGNLERLA